MAIIHIVAANRNAFAGVLSDKRPEILVFEPGKQTRQAIETALGAYRKGFTLAGFDVEAR
jgi:hypothetical protein